MRVLGGGQMVDLIDADVRDSTNSRAVHRVDEHLVGNCSRIVAEVARISTLTL